MALPPAISDAKHLTFLDLNGTGITDIAPLSALKDLKALFLETTQVSDIAALIDHPALLQVFVSGSAIRDLRLLLTGPAFRKAAEEEEVTYGLWLKDSAATRADPPLAEIAEVEDDAERTCKALDHLATLPPTGPNRCLGKKQIKMNSGRA